MALQNLDLLAEICNRLFLCCVLSTELRNLLLLSVDCLLRVCLKILLFFFSTLYNTRNAESTWT